MKHSPTDYVFTGLTDNQKELHALSACSESFGAAILSKVTQKQAEGKHGWADPDWTQEDKLRLLKLHIDKGDMVDVAIFAMFIWNAQDVSSPKPQVPSL